MKSKEAMRGTKGGLRGRGIIEKIQLIAIHRDLEPIVEMWLDCIIRTEV